MEATTERRKGNAPPEGKTRLTVNVDPDVVLRARKASLDTKRTLGDVVAEALERFASANGYPRG